MPVSTPPVAVFDSLTQSARRLELNPFEYLRDVIDRITTTPAEHMDDLTPLGWKRDLARARETGLADFNRGSDEK